MPGSSKNLEPFQIFTAGLMTGNLTSLVTDIRRFDNISIALIFTGTPTGTFAVLGSLDYSFINGVLVNAGTWIPITLASSPAAAGAAGNILLDLNQLSFPFIQVAYTFGSSTGTLNGFISGKAV